MKVDTVQLAPESEHPILRKKLVTLLQFSEHLLANSASRSVYNSVEVSTCALDRQLVSLRPS